jgi:hypothetical protein
VSRGGARRQRDALGWPRSRRSILASNLVSVANAATAKALYLASFTPQSYAADWAAARKAARMQIRLALRASKMLSDIPGALRQSGKHMMVFRHLMAPPVSQDQFVLICPAYKKGKEKNGRSMSVAAATTCGQAFDSWRDKQLTKFLCSSRKASWLEIRRVFITLEPLLAFQQVNTARRNRMAREQEKAVTDLLDSLKWTRVTLGLVDKPGTLGLREYAHKTRFATQTRPQEVDIACGLKNSIVLAMECKVTNDETNSIKRVNDVLKKAAAWQQHWGNFVETAALLQGVIRPADVDRLVNARIEVFWSHDLAAFQAWLVARV